jgi:hypothetical protein
MSKGHQIDTLAVVAKGSMTCNAVKADESKTRGKDHTRENKNHEWVESDSEKTLFLLAVTNTIQAIYT